jgi:hypothetical protein
MAVLILGQHEYAQRFVTAIGPTILDVVAAVGNIEKLRRASGASGEEDVGEEEGE